MVVNGYAGAVVVSHVCNIIYAHICKYICTTSATASLSVSVSLALRSGISARGAGRAVPEVQFAWVLDLSCAEGRDKLLSVHCTHTTRRYSGFQHRI